jgi:uncharacterized membrane protein YeaQ/YmgE (transglycosylase-associated protein family)
MEWTVTNLAIQIVMGFLGAHAAATATREHNFGLLGHSLVGCIGGALSGWLLQTRVLAIVSEGEGSTTLRSADVLVIEALTGAVVGGIAMLAVGLLVNIQKHRKNP